MHKCAKVFGIELTDLLEGHSAKLTGYTVTRKGQGLVTAQRGRHHDPGHGGHVPPEAGDALLGDL